MKPIAVYYHCLFELGDPPEVLPQAVSIVHEQMTQLRVSGLLDAATKLVVGINGGEASREIANMVIPAKAEIIMHGLESRSENLTICALHDFAKENPGWLILYHHSKSCTHDQNSDYGKFATRWRRCMEKTCVTRWRECVSELENGYDAVGAHWLKEMGHDKSQHFFAGNFWWATSDFIATVPSMYTRDRIKVSGISNVESRYEAEVWISIGPLPKTKDMETNHGFRGCP